MTSSSPPLRRTHDAGRSRLVAYDLGAHLARWTVDGEQRVWQSREAVLDGSAPIRGGVPVCFPWFANGPDGRHRPSHGVLRTARWRPSGPRAEEVWAWEIGSDDVADSPGADLVPGPFLARYAVSLDDSPGAERLRLALAVTNTGGQDYAVEVALHTYLGVPDVGRVGVTGLEGAAYLDKTTGRREVQDGPVRLTGETDRVYDRSGPVRVEDGDGRILHEVTPSGASQTVVWNPWAEKAAGLRDLGDEEWREFVCVETVASADRALTVPAGGTAEVSCLVTRPSSPPA